VAPTGPGERAVQLPGFWPDAISFQALADSPAGLPWPTVRADPGLLYFLLNRNIPLAASGLSPVGEADLRAAAEMIGSRGRWTDWRAGDLAPVVRTARAAAHFAELLAVETNAVDPARAWAGGWLAYAGWLAVGVAEPAAVAACLAHPTLADDPADAQIAVWGMTRAEIAWRLAIAWPMPAWARVILGRLDATPAEAQAFGGDRRLQALVQVASVLAEQAGPRLFVADEFDLAAALAELQVNSTDLDGIRDQYATQVDPGQWLDRAWADPREVPGLADRLLAAADATARPAVEESESTVAVDLWAQRVQEAKLAAIAEFAAGASHEINNPLAVISGHSQYLLRHEEDDRRRQALESIVRQTGRIHNILTDLMYFARPPVPRPETLELGQLLREISAAVAPLADERRISVEVGGVTGPLWVNADRKQLAIALAALVRNGVEAAPEGGWVQVTSTFRPDRLEVAVEDNGPGPDERSRAHLFDPFYSGRTAGRGRGLGLSAAWRLAKEHGGEVCYMPMAGGPTRFVLTLPAAAVAAAAQRRTA
jgi:two-component system, NtrC family, sensor kinase